MPWHSRCQGISRHRGDWHHRGLEDLTGDLAVALAATRCRVTGWLEEVPGTPTTSSGGTFSNSGSGERPASDWVRVPGSGVAGAGVGRSLGSQ